jgi:hypothetical protein
MKTRLGVEIGRVGTYPLSTGMHEFTRAQFASAVRNAAGRPAPRIGIGHTDPRWAQIDASKDGEPALGRIENLRLDEDGDVLVGDYVNMPDWFADALPSAFPGRSIEGSCDGDDLILTSVKVLGTKMPGIHTLEDLQELVSDEGPVLVAAGADNDGNEFTVVLGSHDANVIQPEVMKMNTRQKVCEVLGLPANASNTRVRAKAEEVGLIENREQRRQEAAKAIQAAVAEGKFSKDRAPVWREKYERDPEGTRAQLRIMVAIDPQLIAAGAPRSSQESELQHRTRVALGLEPATAQVVAAAPSKAEQKVRRQSAEEALSRSGPAGKGKPAGPVNPLGVPTTVAAGSTGRRANNPDPLFHDGSSPSAVTASADKPAHLTRTKFGTVLYGGVPTRLSERGSRQVFYQNDWIDVDEFQRMGLAPVDSQISIETTQRVGSAAARQTLNEGLPVTNRLGVV